LFSIFIKIFTEHRTEFRLYDVLYFIPIKSVLKYLPLTGAGSACAQM
jgi:hypothetical protein